ncbi:iron chelate uptake ABC transporter family permease subunit [Planctomonas psychrotolerans]|uniref:iron chelate uptake ABC transporter family permease subunit n=1 Tax=Planctomonas psychrotolerans TaxID=2528712 RepID=UPI001D0D5F6A|nr:iron chelate uptake ABC transporter family permease subunit [Planctomonas psychrotolerans]
MSGSLDSVRLRTPAAAVKSGRWGILHSTRSRSLLLVATCVALLLLSGGSMFVGSGSIAPDAVIGALMSGGSDTDSILVTDYRVPRTLLGVVVGVALGLAGALMQAITRNPLADPGILGVNSGAYFAVVLGITVFGASGVTSYVWWAFAGAILTTVAVFLVGSRGRAGATPVRLVLAGVAIGAVLSGISLGITLLNPDTFDRIRFWSVGSLQSRQIDILWGVLPFIVLGTLVALVLSRTLNVVALGDDLAKSLGAHVMRTRVFGLVAITLLCGAATAAVGPISFLGLMAPYVARAMFGPDQRWVVPFTLVIAPVIFLGADMLGRVAVSSELPVGIVTAFVGAPILIVIIRRKQARPL